ncbi:response regulator [Niallia sp. NCCP-28]|uniref:GGDEF domain-containing response regulator n=1 Tax=Niallia sp. NCCP-28 TaxID=2934712 RepID=UPI0020820B3E|nr:response regulator [Niallia sp. NCCP-28]GKU81622.1 hypothetical protein NCCP28_10180 [Niallia sp. NCCP-28]
MPLDKYKNLLIKKMKQQLVNWFENEEMQVVDNIDVYRFLHSIKGTSGTLDMDNLYQLSNKLLNIAAQRTESWKKAELREFLYELAEISWDYEQINEKLSSVSKERMANIPLIQIIDDDISMLIFLKDNLEKKGWMVIANTEVDKAIAQYYDMHPDCIIIDVNLPEKSGFEVLSNLEQHTNRYFVPKIMFSINNDRETRIKAFKMGADDFIEKPIDIEEFLIRIERHLERKEVFDQSVLIDELTQVYNRKFLGDSYNRFISDIIRTNTAGTIAILDIDYFKKVNDSHGHVMGDRVLADFAQFIKKNIRNTDTLFRYGGEEFIVFFQRAFESDVKEILTRMLERFSAIKFGEGKDKFSLSFSAGIYTIANKEIDLQTAIKTADEALYLAKKNGRARIESANQIQNELAKRVMHVSIVDDDALIRSILINIFNSISLDYITLDIVAYEDGMQFFHSNRLKETGLHFLVLDGIMPVMDGLEILQKVRKTTSKQSVHVLMLTGRKSEHDIAEALRLGADDYVTKPFSLTELQARITRLIKRMVQ